MANAACCDLSDISALKRTLSADRLAYWQLDGKHTDAGALILHKRNMFVSAAFYADLQTVEIALRNLMDEALADKFKPADWWDRDGFYHSITADSQWRANETRRVVSTAKSHARSNRHDEILVELGIGFWVALAEFPSLWNGCLETCFQNEPHLTPDTIRKYLGDMRDLRNSIAHHEPVIDGPIVGEFHELVALVRTMCPVTANWLLRHSLMPTLLKIDWLDLSAQENGLCTAAECSLNVFLA